MAQKPMVIGLTAAISGTAHVIVQKIEEEVGEATKEREYLKSTLQAASEKNKTAQKKVAEEIEECMQSVINVNTVGEEKIQRLLQESEGDYEKLRQEYTELLKSLDDKIETCKQKTLDAITEGRTMKEQILSKQEGKETEISEIYGKVVEIKGQQLIQYKEKNLELRLECEEREKELERANREREIRLANEEAKELRGKDRLLQNCVAFMYSSMAEAQELAAIRVMEAQQPSTSGRFEDLQIGPRRLLKNEPQQRSLGFGKMLPVTVTGGADSEQDSEGKSEDELEISEIEEKPETSLERSQGQEPS